MEPSELKFGDIIDARNIGGREHDHFWLVIGINKEKEKILYYKITSRVHKAFRDICLMMEKCRNKDCEIFKEYHSYEDSEIHNHTKLQDAFFLDSISNGLEKDSMISINRDPYVGDFSSIKQIFNKGSTCDRQISDVEVKKLQLALNISQNVNKGNRKIINKCAFEVLKEIKEAIKSVSSN